MEAAHMTGEILKAFEAKLQQLPYGYESMKVFGAIRLNVHITCQSRETANNWVAALAPVGKVTITETMWNAKENKGPALCPTIKRGYLISMVAA
jgi:hypothetical protein